MCLPQFARITKWNRLAPLTSRIDGLQAAGLATLLAVCGSTTQAQQRPDMDMLSFTVSSTLVNRGSSVSVNYNVENEGDWGTQNTWNDGIYLRDSTAAPSASVAPLLDLPHNHFFSLLPGQRYSGFQPPINPTRQVTIPANTWPGQYYLGYFCNRHRSQGWPIPETDYSDNYLVRPITVDGPPDLRITSFTASPQTLMPGGNVTVNISIENHGGNVGNGSAELAFYLSSTTAPQGTPLPTIPLIPPIVLALGQSYQYAPVSVTLPNVALGTYQLVAFIDRQNSVVELSESNNTGAVELRLGPTASATVFGAGCPGTNGVSTIRATLSPRLAEQNFGVEIGNLPQWTLIGLQFGLSNQVWSGGSLPFNLTAQGMPGCFLYQDMLSGWLQNNGVAPNVVFPLPIPSQPSVLGLHLFAQGFVLSPGINPIGVVSTAGLDILIGH